MKYLTGQHGNKGEVKAKILFELLKGNRTRADLKYVFRAVKKEISNKAMDYHISNSKNGLKSLGLVKERKGEISLNINNYDKLVELCKLLSGDSETSDKTIFHIYYAYELAKLFIQDKVQFINRLNRIQLYGTYTANMKEWFYSPKQWGADPVEELLKSNPLEEMIGLLIHVISSNEDLENKISKGVKDPTYNFHGEFFASGLRNVKVISGHLGYFPDNYKDSESIAIKEFIRGLLRPIALEQDISLSFLTLTTNKEEMLKKIDKAEMRLNSLRGKTVSQISRLEIVT